MPSVSEKQRKLMRAAAHNKEFAEKVGVSEEVAKEFYEADKKKAKEEAAKEEEKSKK